MEEIWKDVVGYEGFYKVSNLGNIKSVERNVRNSGISVRTVRERILKNGYRGGYLNVLLITPNIKQCRFSVHRLVAIAFIPNPTHRAEVNHIDGNKKNNKLDNLEWVTRSENFRHSYKLGLSTVWNKGKIGIVNVGSAHGMSKLVESDILNILELHNNGMSNRDISKLFKVSSSSIDNVINKKTWIHVKIKTEKLEVKDEILERNRKTDI